MSLNILVFDALRSTSVSGSRDEPSLETCKRQRRSGDFLGAIHSLARLDPADPAVAFEKLRTFFDQGYLQRAQGSCNPVMELEQRIDAIDVLKNQAGKPSDFPPITESERRLHSETPIARCLLRLAYDYLDCLTRGLWEKALEHAKEVYAKYLSDWRTPGDVESSFLLVSTWILSGISTELNGYQIYLEIFYHRIYLEAHRDLGLIPDGRSVVHRLQALREHLQALGHVPEAYDVLVMELEFSKRSIRNQYLEHEGAFTIRGYIHQPQIALPIIKSFLDSPLFHEQELHYVEEGYGRLLAAELLRESGGQFSKYVAEAESIFRSCGCEVGLLDVAYFKVTEVAQTDFAVTNTLYRSLKLRDDISRMRRVRRLHVATISSIDDGAMNWQETQRDALAKLANEAGDAYSHGIWKLRKYSNDFMAASVIDINEKVFDTANEVQSELLATVATYNLSRAYLIQGNTMEAAANAILHFQLTYKQLDQEQLQRAILNVLNCLEEEFNNKSLSRQSEILTEIASSWTGLLEDSAILRWVAGHPRCDEIDRFITGALFLPNLAGKFASGHRGRPDVLKPLLASDIVSHLHIAFALFESLPAFFSSLMLPKLSSALASAAIYCENNELAVLAYSEGLRSCHTGDGPTINCLQGWIGKRLTHMALTGPEQWLHVLAAGRSFLTVAEKFYYENPWLSGSMELGCQVSNILAGSYVAEARARKLSWERGGGSGGPLVEMVVSIYPLAKTSIGRALREM